MRVELQHLLNHNNQVSELEQLDKDEFIINLEEKTRLEQEGDDRSSQVQFRIEKENATRRVIWKKLMSELWSSMEEKGKEIHGVVADMNLKVTNFPVPVVAEQRQITYERAFMHRRIELREIQQSHRTNVWPGVCEETQSGVQMSWMVNEGKLKADPNVLTEAETMAAEALAESEAEKGNDASGVNMAAEGGDAVTKEEELLEMLYRPLALRTSGQKRIQVLLYEQLIREMKMNFNSKFDDCFALKENKLDEINSKNNRIAEILAELKISEEYFKPIWSNAEFPDRVITVADSEIPIEKYISEAERKQLLLDEEERKKNAANDQGDNAPERALLEMMGGTLEQEQGLNALEQELVREVWMDELLFEEMSEDQKKILEEFETRQKSLLEEKEKYRKGLELELKKLRQDISDLCRSVDEKIGDLLSLKMATQMQVHVQELYSLRLVLVLMEDEDDKRELQKIRIEMMQLKLNSEIGQQEYLSFSEQINGKKAIIETMKSKEKEMDKNFKKTMQDMSSGGAMVSETLTTLTNLYKTRSAQGDGEGESGGARNSLFTGASSSVGGGNLENIRQQLNSSATSVPETSPFYLPLLQIASRNPELAKSKERDNSMVPLDLENDVPEGFECPVEILQKLQELRLNRIDFELDIKHLENEVETMAVKESQLHNSVLTIANDMKELLDIRTDMNERIVLSSSNIEGNRLASFCLFFFFFPVLTLC